MPGVGSKLSLVLVEILQFVVRLRWQLKQQSNLLGNILISFIAVSRFVDLVSSLRAQLLLNCSQTQGLLPDPSDLKVTSESDIANSVPNGLVRNLIRFAFHSRESFELERPVGPEQEKDVFVTLECIFELILQFVNVILGSEKWWPKQSNLLPSEHSLHLHF